MVCLFCRRARREFHQAFHILGAMVVASMGSFVLGGIVALVLGAGFVCLLGYAAYRIVRRRWRIIATHTVVKGMGGVWSTMTSNDLQGLGRRLGSLDTSSFRSLATRRRLWRAVQAAEHAVAGAESIGASVGELPALATRLHANAERLDTLLATRIVPGPQARTLRAQLDESILAADSIRDGAVLAAQAVSAPATAALALDAEHEMQSLAAGHLRAAGTALRR
jgi:hypothetical protein